MIKQIECPQQESAVNSKHAFSSKLKITRNRANIKIYSVSRGRNMTLVNEMGVVETNIRPE